MQKKNRIFTCFTKRVPYHIIHHLSKITREKTRISRCNMLSHIIKTYIIFVPQNKKKKDLGISRQMHYFCNEIKVNGKYESLALHWLSDTYVLKLCTPRVSHVFHPLLNSLIIKDYQKHPFSCIGKWLVITND